MGFGTSTEREMSVPPHSAFPVRGTSGMPLQKKGFHSQESRFPTE